MSEGGNLGRTEILMTTVTALLSRSPSPTPGSSTGLLKFAPARVGETIAGFLSPSSAGTLETGPGGLWPDPPGLLLFPSESQAVWSAWPF